MGCVRDSVKLQHFSKKITQFRQATGVSVRIITYNQKSKTALRNGISHENLLQTLQNHCYRTTSVWLTDPAARRKHLSTKPQRPSTSSTSESISPPSVLCCDESRSEFGVGDDSVQLVSNLPQPVFTPISSPNLNSNRTFLNSKS